MVKKYLFLFAFFGLFTSFDNHDSPKQSKQFIVVLDAGHGGHDPGNLGNGYLEKNIALNIVLQAGKVLSRNPDIKVIYTRKDDTFVDLYKRGEIANKANADLFVSVHCDSFTNPDAYGAHTFVMGLHANRKNYEVAKKENSVIYLEDNYQERYASYDINSPESVIGLTVMQEEYLDQSIQVAALVQKNFTSQLKRKDRKVKQAGFIVLHQTFMPSVLVETGFLTNKNEGAYLNSKKGQNEMGTAIANAVISYKNGVRASFNTNEEPIVDVPETDVNVVEENKKNEEKEDKIETTTTIYNEESKPKVNAETASTSKVKVTSNRDKVVFRVQIMASAKNIFLDPKNFNGLDILTKEPYKNLYRYMYGNSTSYSYAKELKARADAAGYTTSYIVVYKDGFRVPLTDAIIRANYN